MNENIFLSHTRADKPIVDYFADNLSRIFGRDRVFYDTWSMSPGESFIGRMNEGLTDCGFFFLFISKASLESKMVNREWQSSLNMAIKGELKFIPVLLEHIPVPPIFGDIGHLSLYRDGPETVLKQMVDVIQGTSNTPLQPLKKNLLCHVSIRNNTYDLAIEATMYMEPKSSFLIVPDCPIEKLQVTPHCTMVETNTFSVKAEGGPEQMGYWIMVEYATVPKFPFRLTISHRDGIPLKFGVYHQIGEHDFEPIQLVIDPKQ